MVFGGLAVLFVLVVALTAVSASAGNNSRTVRARDVAPVPYPWSPWPHTKQDVNTTTTSMPVHHVAATTACWPGVWVGPCPEASPVDHSGELGKPLVQRRHPSGVAGRITPHGVIR